ncbi:hypothetical protein G7Y89_g8575 [Cudoniella acicularis]|uniref:Uncharacterized protein n=1 Tax=Cudoniella acicularis TaxID=354080 RepID=A0A8H4W0H4_9HELO|nr:hypothetical protein G7Y89_g8575 [Cudoniella acicularis]
MEGPQRRDINELLTQGFFTTARGKSPSSSSHTPRNSSSYLQTEQQTRDDRSRSRGRRPRPPRPTVEDEAVSLAKESSTSSKPPSYDPPLRGIIDQVPIILEADVISTEAARLQAEPQPGEKSQDRTQNQEKRFVLVHQSDGSTNSENVHGRKKSARPKEASNDPEPVRTQSSGRGEKRESLGRPPIQRQRSRQDLPSLETKVPREIPPQYRRSASASAVTPTDQASTPKPRGRVPQTPSGDSFLSPNISRASNDYFGAASAPKYQGQESFGGRAVAPASDIRPTARPTTPTAEKRTSEDFDGATRSQRNNERLSQPRQLPEEYSSRRPERRTSYERPSTGLSSRSSGHSRSYYDSSEDEISDSGLDNKYKTSSRGSRGPRPYPDDEYDLPLPSPPRSNRSSLERKTISRHTSPLVSPKVSPSQFPRADQFERSETFPLAHHEKRPSVRAVSPLSANQETPRADRLNPLDAAPNPRARSRSNASQNPPMQTLPYPQNPSLPIPIPSRIDLHSPGDSRRTPSIPQFDEGKDYNPRPGPASHWQPPTFQPPSSNLEKPVGAFRRYSQDIESGTISPLPACPRTTFTRGRNDWLTLPNCPEFDICPSCYNSIIAPTEFRNHFIPSPHRSQDVEVLCDFGSSPWYRIAWLLTLKQRRRDLKLFQGLAKIATTEHRCLGKDEGVRKWHSIIDPKTSGIVHNFNVCPNCVKSIEMLLPAMRGIFVKKDNPPGTVRVCDLRFESKRFVQYFDALEVTADHADRHDIDPDTRELVSFVRRMSQVDECEGDTDFLDKKWHIITQLPEFTVCEECYDEVVWPELEDRKAIPLLFNKTLQRIPKASCQLYSPKTRGIFRTAVDANDYKLLASKARERKTIELAYKANVSELKRNAKLNPVAVENELKRVQDEWKRWE